MVEVLEFGAKKYSPDNWKKGLDQKEVIESMLRHAFALLTAIQEGKPDDQYDKDSGLHHIGHIMCNCMFYAYHDKNNSFKNKNGNEI